MKSFRALSSRVTCDVDKPLSGRERANPDTYSYTACVCVAAVVRFYCCASRFSDGQEAKRRATAGHLQRARRVSSKRPETRAAFADRMFRWFSPQITRFVAVHHDYETCTAFATLIPSRIVFVVNNCLAQKLPSRDTRITMTVCKRFFSIDILVLIFDQFYF